jgi:hypothetical protein
MESEINVHDLVLIFLACALVVLACEIAAAVQQAKILQVKLDTLTKHVEKIISGNAPAETILGQAASFLTNNYRLDALVSRYSKQND